MFISYIMHKECIYCLHLIYVKSLIECHTLWVSLEALEIIIFLLEAKPQSNSLYTLE